MNCIYKIICNDEIYIGSTSNFHKRKLDHKYRMNNPKYSHLPIYKKMNETEYKIEIIQMVEKDKKLREIENQFIKELKPSLNSRNAIENKERRRLLKNERERNRRKDINFKIKEAKYKKEYYIKNQERLKQKSLENYHTKKIN